MMNKSSKKTKTGAMLYVGVDVAKATLVSARLTKGQSQAIALSNVSNEPTGFEALGKQVDAARPSASSAIRLVVEPTGGYEARLILWAYARGWQVVMVNPKQVREWIKGLGQRAKTDTLDAKMLAQYAAERPENKPLPLWRPLPETLTELNALVARRQELEQMLRQEHNRQQMYQGRPGLQGAVSTSVTTVTTALETSLGDIDQAIKNLIDQHPDMGEQIAQLDSIPGVGEKVRLPLFALLARWNVMTGGQGSDKALTAFVGLDAQTRESGGRSHYGRISKIGDSHIRALLYMAALGGLRCKHVTPLRQFYDHLLKRGKPKMVALVAVARKILVWAWAMFRSHSYFDAKKYPQPT
jgi:transposase